ncbi:HPP family protein [Thermoactinospora rubra]|uniref:CBS domain-containing protein n=1 Tax=Thermoactinospora rubra TaxID=1088767 RepID=UPI000A0FF122|nr:CBS domain-containing protein [Thermoactinospora rubra]
MTTQTATRTSADTMTASQVMSRILVAVSPEETPLLAWEIMRRAEVHHLPVVEGARLLGLLSREDLTRAWSGNPETLSRQRVRTLLSGRRQPYVRPEDPLPRVAAAMLDAGRDAVPVMADGALAGLVTVNDVLAAVAGRIRPAESAGTVVSGMFRLEPVLPEPVDG